MEQKLTVLLLLTVYLSGWKIEAKNNGPQGRITGGEYAAEGTIPYMVSLQTRWGHFCGAAIIDKQWIVTAAHCVVNKYSDDVIVYSGTQDLAKSEEAVFYYVDRMFVHCNFDEPRQANDIALLHLNDSIELNEKTKIIPLATKPLKNGDLVTLTGWGQEDEYGDIVDRLKTIDLNFIPHKACKAAHNKTEHVHVGHICTFTRRGEGSCIHDSGGPLVRDGNLVGVVNWGTPCAVGDPDVYSSILYYYDWLHTIMTSDGNCDCNAFIKKNRKKKTKPNKYKSNT